MSGRIRSIKPELLDDERVARLSGNAFRLFVGCLLLADDYGNHRWVTRWLQGQIFWGRPEVTIEDVEAAQVELIGDVPGKGLFHAYQVNDQWYAHVGGWEKHQKVDHPGKPRVPRPEDSKGFECFPAIRETLAKETETLASVSESLAPDLRSPISDLDLRGGENSRDSRERNRDSPYDLAWRVWTELWPGRWGEAYVRGTDTGPLGDDRKMQAIGAKAATHGAKAEAELRSRLARFFADGGAWLVANHHPVRAFEADWNKYGNAAPPAPEALTDDDDELPPPPPAPEKTAEQCAERARWMDAQNAQRKIDRERRAKIDADLARGLAAIGNKS
jgi:hypothetical protein